MFNSAETVHRMDNPQKKQVSQETCILSLTKSGESPYLEHNSNNRTHNILRTYFLTHTIFGCSHIFPHLIIKSLMRKMFLLLFADVETDLQRLRNLQSHLTTSWRCQNLKPGVSNSGCCALFAIPHYLHLTLYLSFYVWIDE